MATYINLHGNNVPIVSSDPSNPINGEIWYNSSTKTFKGHLYAPAAFSTGGTVPQIVRGGGSGGRSFQTGAGNGTAGGSGVVIIRYKIA